ncbi:DNA polymerase III subunit alpha [Candidatus Jidaibacter acanthamoeba]|uniref:DNA polymerase III subunit alpha n=1 Tax=Candidatus Jidaibacter acanthamoebae TaxID=86105 RepID=A0A0C1QQ05_9RICK|nr:DNA polymerase III subunit alpha [Candidatus Jidaibacter acanthamoeba]KIE05968.1 DNA polymerase III subunit alpha [Candidatus Jidaibacter acanthamoeba]
MKTFIHLRAHSDYSLGMSAVKIKELAKKCVEYKFPAICLADHKNLFGALEFSQACIKSGVQPIIGCIVKVEYDKKTTLNRKSLGEVLLIAKNKQGYQNLMKIVSHSFLSSDSLEDPNISLDYLLENIEGLIALTGGKESILGKYVLDNKFEDGAIFLEQLKKRIKDDLYIEVQRNVDTYNEEFEQNILKYAQDLELGIVATNDIYFLTPQMHIAQDALYCIAEARKLEETERPSVSKDCYLKSTEEMFELFKDLPEAIENTVNIAKKCLVYSETSKPLLPSFSTANKANEDEILSEFAKEGLRKRLAKLQYTIDEEEYFKRLDFELSVIIKMRFAGYFLIVSDFIKWSKNNGVPVGPGRGSGAGSLVAWAIDITDLDPIKFGLLFERFLNPDRISMPDFDIDFCQERREEVIKYVKEKYGEDRVANIITFGKLQPRAVLRDVGRVLGMDYMTVDRICKMVPNNPANPVTLSQAINLDRDLQGQRDTNPVIAKLLSIGLQLEGMNRHVSTHAAGIVIADRPLVEVVPLYRDDNSPMPIIQFNMKAAEDAGLVKFDFLGLKTLTVISWACDLINKKETENFDIGEISLEDKKTFKLLSRGETVGVFQFESVGMKETIKKLKPDKIEDLIALGSLYRPGPMDNIPSYINRKHGYEKPQYLHPKLEEILKETYGIIVYQEQVIIIAQALAGYTLGEADLLRRAMGKKIQAEMDANREVFIQGAVKNGIGRDLAEEIFNLIDKFASYGFNKSHAAAYAIISYQTAFLKANYPLEFFTASLNLEIDDADKINLFLNDARNYNITILPPSINHSEALFVIEDKAIRYGLSAIKNVGRKAVEEIIKIRKEEGEFKDLEDFLIKAGLRNLNKRMLEGLSKAGAFDCFNTNRNSIFKSVEKIISWTSMQEENASTKQASLFEDIDIAYQKIFLENVEQWNTKQTLEAEFEAFGFYLSSHPIEEYAVKLRKMNITFACEIDSRVGSKSSKLNFAGVITSKKIKSSARGKFAFIQLSDKTGLFDVSIFDEKQLVQYNEEGLLEVGKVVFIVADAKKDNTGLRIIIDSMSYIEDALKDVKTTLKITIKDREAINIIKDSITEIGIPIKLAVCIDGEGEVFFKNNKPIFIDREKISMLKNSSALEIKEE